MKQSQIQPDDVQSYSVTADKVITIDWTVAMPSGPTISAAGQTAWEQASWVEQPSPVPVGINGKQTQHTLSMTKLLAGHYYVFQYWIHLSDGSLIRQAQVVLATT